MHDTDDITRARRRMEAVAEITRWIWCANLAAAVIGFALKRFDAAILAAMTAVLAIAAAGLSRRAAACLGPPEPVEMESEVDEPTVGSDYRRSYRARA